MVNSKPMDLVQAITTDCSVVASLCAAAAREERGHHKVHDDNPDDIWILITHAVLAFLFHHLPL